MSDKALKYAQESNRIANKLDFAKGKARSLFLIGLYWHFNSDFTKALKNYNESLSIYTKLGDKKQNSICLNNIGLINQTNGAYYQALEYYLKSLRIQEELGDKKVISACFNNIGIIHKKQDNYTLAIEYFEKSLKVNKEINNKYGISRNLMNIGNIHKKQGNYQQAIEYYEKSFNIAKEINDKESVSTNVHNIGEIYLLQENYPQALIQFQKSLEIKEKIGDKELNCSSLFFIGTIYLKTKNYTKALNYTMQSLEIAEKFKLLNNQKEIHEQLSKIFFVTKKYKQAHQEHMLYHKLNDSIFNAKNKKKIASLELQYKFEKETQKKEASYTEKLTRQKIITNIIFVGFFVIVLILFLVYRLFRIKKKSNNLLVIKNKKVLWQKKQISAQNAEIQLQANSLQKHKEQLEETVKQRTSELHTEKEKVEESEERFRAITEQASEGITLADLNGNYVYINSAFCKMTGYSEAELLKMTIFDILENKENIEINSNLFSISSEFLLKRKNHTLFPVTITINPITISKQKLLLGMFTDISERKKAEKALNKSENRFENIFENSPTGIISFDLNGNAINVNNQVVKILGSPSIKATKQINVLQFENLKKIGFSDAFIQCIKTRKTIKRESNYTTKWNKHKYIRYTLTPISDNNIITCILGIYEDVTKQKIAEKELIKAKEKAEESDQLKTEFINNMSHEIRTPMNAILGFSSFLNDSNLTNEKRKYYINIVQNSGNQLLRIIDDILEISKLVTKQVKVSKKEICLNDLLLVHFSATSLKLDTPVT